MRKSSRKWEQKGGTLFYSEFRLSIRERIKVERIITKSNRIKALLTLLIPIAIIAIRPISLSLDQSIVLGTLFLVISWWGTEWVHKDVASALLLIVFLIFSDTEVTQVLNFPCSTNIIMIVAAYLLSQGIVNAGIAEQFSNYCIKRFCRNGRHLVVMAFVLAVVLLIVIPQPFPRVVLLATIYSGLLQSCRTNEDNNAMVLMGVFIAVPITSIMLLNGDVIVNYAAMGFGEVNFSFAQWAEFMMVPTVVIASVTAFLYTVVYKKDLDFSFEASSNEGGLSIGREGKLALSVMLLVIVLWLTESFHGIDPAVVALLGTVLMFVFRIVRIKDFKVISPSLLLFLTAEFSIGRVLTGSGVAEKIKDVLVPILPPIDSIFFIPVIALIIMLLHMIMGSVVTAVSFSIPMLVIITDGYWSSEFVVLFVLVIVAFQFILPFHNINIMIGFGGGYYKNKHAIRSGIFITVITIAGLFLFYLPWWNIVGLV